MTDPDAKNKGQQYAWKNIFRFFGYECKDNINGDHMGKIQPVTYFPQPGKKS
jgi:hypothetical protein